MQNKRKKLNITSERSTLSSHKNCTTVIYVLNISLVSFQNRVVARILEILRSGPHPSIENILKTIVYLRIHPLAKTDNSFHGHGGAVADPSGH